MVDQKVSALTAINAIDVDNNVLLYCVDVTGGNLSRSVSRANLYLGVANVWTKKQTYTTIDDTQLLINVPASPAGSASQLIGAINIPNNTVGFSGVNPQTADYVGTLIGQATFTNPSAGTIPNAATVKILGASIASSNVVITNNYALWIAAGATYMQGPLTINTGSSPLVLYNPGGTFTYTLTTAALTANRTLNLPLITGTDTLVTLNLSQTFTQGQTITPITSNGLILNPPTGPTGTASEFIGGLSVPAGTVAFLTTHQTGDYVTNKIDQANLTNVSSGTITNAASMKIVGAPIASTNVTITNNYALWVAAGTTLLQATTIAGVLTSTGGITMSSADITLGGNNLKTTTYSIFENTIVSNNSVLFQPSSGNTNSVLSIAPKGTSVTSWLVIERTSTLANEKLFLGSDINTSNEFALVFSAGSGTAKPGNVYQGSTKLLSFDTANTITSYVNFEVQNTTQDLYRVDNTAGSSAPVYFEYFKQNSSNGKTGMSQFATYWTSNTAGAESASTIFYIKRAGSYTNYLEIGVNNGVSIFTKLVNYNNIATAGIGVIPVYGSTIQKSETGADTNVLTLTPPAVAGSYRIKISVDVSAATVATFGWTATWKDSNGTSQAPTNLVFDKAGSATLNLTVSAAANDHYTADMYIDIDNSATNIVIKTTFTGTSIAYKISASIEQIQ